MSNFYSLARRFCAGAFLFVLIRGIFLWLGMYGIHPDQWVADMLNWASSPQALGAITWTIAGVSGLLGLIFWPVLKPRLHHLVRKQICRLMSFLHAALIP